MICGVNCNCSRIVNLTDLRPSENVEAQRYRIHFTIKDVPDPIPLIVGDLVTCLRASLDHLVWVLAALKRPYPKNTEFPILDAPNERFMRRCTKGVPTEARRIIVSLQPYLGRQPEAIRSHLLWRLNKLCNVDKHRRIPVHSDISYMHFPDLPKKFGHLVEFDSENVVVSVPLELERYMRLEPDASFNIVFGDSVEGVEIDIEGLSRLYEFVTNDVLPRFARFFQ
jgi:hypothetical protein